MVASLDFKHHQFIKNYLYYDGHYFYKFENVHFCAFVVYRQDDTTKEFNYYTTITLKELQKFVKYHHKFIEKMKRLKSFRKEENNYILKYIKG